MSKWIHNKTGAERTYEGVPIADDTFYQIPSAMLSEYQNNADLLADLAAGTAAMSSNGTDEIDGNESQHVAFLLSLDLSPKDADGTPLTHTKHTKTGWHYEPRSLDFVTSKHLSLYNRKHDGNTMSDGTDYGDATLKFYDDAGVELSYQQTGHEEETDGQFQTRLSMYCVRSIMDWQPTYDMDIIGGILMVRGAPVVDTYMWTIVAPDIPEFMGGSVPHVAGGWNLSFFTANDKIIVNGRGSKTIVYDPVYNSNKFRTVVKHAVGAQIGLQMVYEHFKA